MTRSSTSTATDSSPPNRLVADGAARRAIVGGSVGNFMEWYEFVTYAYFATVIGKLFFSSPDPLTEFLSAFVVYASSYFVRPIGAAVCGRLADRWGRRPTLILTLVGMAAATTLTGVLPTYGQVGVLAPVLLVVLRLVQGLSAGGEFGGAVSLMAEFAPNHRRGLYSSWQSFTVGLGLLAGSGLATLLTSVLSHDQMASWGWRLPFLLGGVLGAFALYLRRQVDETPVFERMRRRSRGSADAPVERSRPLRFGVPVWALVPFLIGALLAWTAAGNVFLVVLPSYTATTLHTSSGVAELLSFVANIAFTVTIPVFGWLSDRLGRRLVMMTGAVLILLLAYPLFLAISLGNLTLMFAGVAVAGVAVAMMAGPGPAMLAELFPSHVRVTGLGFGYALSAAVFGGSAALIIGWLSTLTGDPLAAAYYPMIGGAVSIVCLSLLGSTHRAPLREA